MKIRFNAPPAVDNELNGLTVKYAAARRQLPRLRWYLLLILVTAPLVYLIARIAMGFFWDASPGFVAIPQITLKATANGRVDFQLHEGDVTPAGGLVARIIPIAMPEPLAPQNSLDVALAKLEAEKTYNRLTLSKAAMRLAEEQYARMDQRLATVNRLVSEGAATAAERAQAEAQLSAAKSDVLRARADMEDTQSTLRRLDLTRTTPAETPTRAPEVIHDIAAPLADSVVRMLVSNQNWVAAGTDLALIQLQSEPEVRVFVSPSDERNARVGVRADLRFLDGYRMGATVVKVEAETARMPPDRVGPLATRLQSIVAVLKPDQPLPAHYKINELPLDVRFGRTWF
jgi:multidrug efflux pump subunit AcrA (membrane-fusion protein)